MKIYRNIKLSIKALLVNKTRTYFSIAGMAVGIAAVTVTVAIGESAKQKALDPIKAMGTNVIVINAGKFTEVFGRAREVTNVTTLKLQDVSVLHKNNSIEKISPFQERLLPVKYQGRSTNSLIQGVSTEYPSIRNYTLNQGEFFTDDQNKMSERLAVLGSQTANNLFKNENPLDKIIYINNIPFTVIGSLNPKGSTSEMGNIDNVVMIPVKTILRRVLNIDYLAKIYLQVREIDHMDITESYITEQLKATHQLKRENEKDDFTIINQLNAIHMSEETSNSFNILILGVAVISLIIGGSGILTVMILSVRERITEIGLRISVGARKRNIVFQFMYESLILGFAGGLTGTILGYLISLVLNKFTDWTTTVSMQALLTSIGFSMIVGLIFGVFPALRAAKSDPINALKAE
ncbi:MAG: ABC transporter permease [Bacteroidales bacterium]|nr:ABC transporter permease [Bacteroidales bacterium]